MLTPVRPLPSDGEISEGNSKWFLTESILNSRRDLSKTIRAFSLFECGYRIPPSRYFFGVATNSGRLTERQCARLLTGVRVTAT